MCFPVYPGTTFDVRGFNQTKYCTGGLIYPVLVIFYFVLVLYVLVCHMRQFYFFYGYFGKNMIINKEWHKDDTLGSVFFKIINYFLLLHLLSGLTSHEAKVFH